MLAKLTGEQLLEILNDTEYPARRYSGRGMGGAECVALTVENRQELYAVAQIVNRADDELRPLVVNAFRRAETDNMGRSSVVIYFPNIAWPADAQETPDYEFDDHRDWDAEDEGDEGGEGGAWDEEDD